MNLYLDASVLLAMQLAEPRASAAYAVLSNPDEDLLVSEYAVAELASGLSRLLRMKGLTREQADARLVDFESWRSSTAELIEVAAADVRLAGLFVRRFELGLRTPDALHIAIARRAGAKLVTLDRRMAGAARALGVDTVIPGEAP